MTPEDTLYEKWKASRQALEPAADLTDKIMSQISTVRPCGVAPKLRERMGSLPLGAAVKLGLLGAGTIGGLIRVLVILRLLFGCSQAKGFF